MQLELYSQHPSIIAPYKTPRNDSFLITNLINHNNEMIMKEKERERSDHVAQAMMRKLTPQKPKQLT